MSQARHLPREAPPPTLLHDTPMPNGHHGDRGLSDHDEHEPMTDGELDALLTPMTYTVHRGVSFLWPWGQTTP